MKSYTFTCACGCTHQIALNHRIQVAAEEQGVSDDSVSTILPTFERFESWVHSYGGMDNRNIYEWFVRQLRAGCRCEKHGETQHITEERGMPALQSGETPNKQLEMPILQEVIKAIVSSPSGSAYDQAVTAGINECYRYISRHLGIERTLESQNSHLIP